MADIQILESPEILAIPLSETSDSISIPMSYIDNPYNSDNIENLYFSNEELLDEKEIKQHGQKKILNRIKYVLKTLFSSEIDDDF